uniref:Uncharacterized protein n=1 Tax=Anguilla anguilla TaxID=7936 RepID=A0A0E9W2P2_ANGAN
MTAVMTFICDMALMSQFI